MESSRSRDRDAHSAGWESAGPPVDPQPSRLVLLAGGVALLALGILAGATLLDDVGETPCYQILEEAGVPGPHGGPLPPVEDREAARELVDLAEAHPGCFDPEIIDRFREYAESKPGTLGILQRTREPADDLPSSVDVPEGLVERESRLAQHTETAKVYVAPQHVDGQREGVCVVVIIDQEVHGSMCTDSIGPTGLQGTMTTADLGIVGLVSDGHNAVIVGGDTVPVIGNVFVVEGARPGIPVELPE